MKNLVKKCLVGPQSRFYMQHVYARLVFRAVYSEGIPSRQISNFFRAASLLGFATQAHGQSGGHALSTSA
jgi:hypothetical protein